MTKNDNERLRSRLESVGEASAEYFIKGLFGEEKSATPKEIATEGGATTGTLEEHSEVAIGKKPEPSSELKARLGLSQSYSPN
jgi:hypothetical protein